jgi:hypothetical protein
VRRQRQARQAIFAELRAQGVSSSRGCVVPCGVKRKMRNFALRSRRSQRTRLVDHAIDVIVRHRPPKGTATRRHNQLYHIAHKSNYCSHCGRSVVCSSTFSGPQIIRTRFRSFGGKGRRR